MDAGRPRAETAVAPFLPSFLFQQIISLCLWKECRILVEIRNFDELSIYRAVFPWKARR